jgi:hypothetical protein
MDRRRANRYELEAPVEFSWTEVEGKRHREQGLTRNISEFGIFVVTKYRPALGTPMSFEVSFPSETGQRVRIQASGPVVRLETPHEPQGQCGFAAAISETRVFGEELRKPLPWPNR